MGGSAPLIRTARHADARAVTDIYIRSWNEGFAGRMPRRQVDDALVARWARDLAMPAPHRWWVAERSGAILGFAGIGASRDPLVPDAGELDTIAVDPGHWREGVGQALMAVALDHLRADGCREAILWTLAGYGRGHGFYTAAGWHPDGGRRDEGRQVRYRLPLDPARGAV